MIHNDARVDYLVFKIKLSKRARAEIKLFVHQILPVYIWIQMSNDCSYIAAI